MGRRTNDLLPDAYSMIKRGMDRWYELIGMKWGSRYLVLWYKAWKSSTASKTGYLSEWNTKLVRLDPETSGVKHYIVCFSKVFITVSKINGDCAIVLDLSEIAIPMRSTSDVPAGTSCFSNTKFSCSWIEPRGSALTVNIRWRVWKANAGWR